MIRCASHTWVLAFASLSAAAALAQTPQLSVTPLPLSMKRAVEIATAPDGNARVALAREAIRQAEERTREARGAFLPNLEGSVQQTRQITNLQAYGFGLGFFVPIPGFSIPAIAGPFNVFDARASGQLSLLNFADMRRYAASKSIQAAARSDANTTRDQIASEVARDYLVCLRADAAVNTARANVELAQALLKLAQQEKNAGTGTGIEVTRAQVQLANDEQLLIRAENDRTRAVLVLLRTIGLRMDAPVEFTSTLEYRPVEIESAESLIERARRFRPEFKTQQQREDAARLSYRAVKAEHFPSIGASANFGTIGTDIPSARPTYMIGGSVRIPLFDGGRREARQAESFSQYRQEQVRMRDLNQQVELEVRSAIENLRSAAAEVGSARQGLALAENELAQAERRYRAGVATSLEVTDAQTRLQRARDNQLNALYDHDVARLELAAATGTIGDYVNQ